MGTSENVKLGRSIVNYSLEVKMQLYVYTQRLNAAFKSCLE